MRAAATTREVSTRDAGPTPEAEAAFGIADVLLVIAHGAGRGDLAAIGRDIGRTSARPDERPDETPEVHVRFVDELRRSPLHLLDGGTSGYGPEGVFFLDPGTSAPLACVSLGKRWGEVEIVCRRGLKRIPFLSPAVDLAAVSRGWVPLHGSGWVTREGVGVLATGWAHSGKTGAMLAACEAGAAAVGDDRILLSRDGSAMVGTGRPIEVKDWHMAQLRLPSIGDRPVRRTLARAGSALDGLRARIPGGASGLPAKALGRLRRTLSMELPPERLSAPAIAARPDVLFILETHRHPRVVAEPVDSGEIARRVAAQTEGELLPALRAQLPFKYALAEVGWQNVGRAPELTRVILEEATAGIPAHLIRHPYPCSLRELDGVLTGILEEM